MEIVRGKIILEMESYKGDFSSNSDPEMKCYPRVLTKETERTKETIITMPALTKNTELLQLFKGHTKEPFRVLPEQ